MTKEEIFRQSVDICEAADRVRCTKRAYEMAKNNPDRESDVRSYNNRVLVRELAYQKARNRLSELKAQFKTTVGEVWEDFVNEGLFHNLILTLMPEERRRVVSL